MEKKIDVLIVEDEPLIVDALKKALHYLSENNGLLDFNVKVAKNCDLAKEEIDYAMKSNPIELLLLDISLPASRDGKLSSGVDIGLKAKRTFPKIKTIVFTSHNNNYKLNNILKDINPEGFLIKSDIDFSKLVKAITTVINDEPYYSKQILQLMRCYLENDFVLDKIDRQLLYEISKGAKMNEITNIIPLSKSAIEYRKRNLKQLFDVQNGNDRQLVIKAKKRGFI